MTGTTISHYQILEKLGQGGMGVVYKAEDTTLKRIVALKFLPPHVSDSDTDKARFLLEAQAAAALNHPNICTIYGIEEVDGKSFIAMEFVDGQTLRAKRGTIGLPKAIDIGIQVAEGLSAAHEKGIVHRDIKPENIMVRKDGLVQVMDFGLAKLRASRASRLTKEGSTVGTAGYMSPEQIQGQETDHRSDIFSLGVLLYELFTGEPPFKGVHETALLYEIVNVDPAPMSTVNPEIDPELDRIVLECLQKEPDERYNAVKDIAKDLKRFKRESSKQRMSRTMSARPALSASGKPAAALASPATSGFSVREIAAWGMAALFVAVAAYLYFRAPAAVPAAVSQAPLVRSSITVPESVYVHAFGARSGRPVLSPDGRAVIFIGVTADGERRVYVRRLDDMVVRPVGGTGGAANPFWSPDGKAIGFFADGKLKKIDLVSGSPVTICPAVNERGGTWSEDGTIVFTPDFQSGLYRVPAQGGATPVQITTLDSTRHEGSHRWPYFLPDGKHVLAMVRTRSESGDAEGDAIYAFSLDGKERKMLVQSSFNAAYANGYLLFAQAGVLLAQRFDPATLTLTGDAVKIQEGLLTDVSYNVAVFSVSSRGELITQTGESIAGARPLILDRTGRVIHTIEDGNEQDYPRYSPDGKEVVLYLYDLRSRRSNLWAYDLRTDTRRRLTTGASGEFSPVWSADGRSVYYTVGGPGLRNEIYVTSALRSGEERPFVRIARAITANDATRDGKWLVVCADSDSGTQTDLYLVPSAGGSPVPYRRTRFREEDARVSPDGRWIAYTSDESGDDEIYLLPLADPSATPVKVSSGGGAVAQWGATSAEVIYANPRGQIMAASLRYPAAGPEVAGTAALFRLPPFTLSYELSRDGKSVFVTRSLEMRTFPPLALTMNWQGLLPK